MGGEKTVKVPALVVPTGSPPRGRGKVVGHSGVLLDVGITHAWAGKRLTRPAMTGTPRDHPRVGGEKVHLTPAHSSLLGSPPHGRGKGRRIVPNVEGLRITPVWAGKRLFRNLCSRRR